MSLLTKHVRLLGGSPISVFAITVAVFIGWQGVMALPIQIGAVVEGLGASEQRSGFLGSVEITTMALTTIFLAVKIGEWAKPKVALTGLGFIIAGQLLSAVVSNLDVLLVLRITVGFGAGLMYGAACSCIAGNPSGDRLFAWGLGLGQILIGTMLLGLSFVASKALHQGVFITLAILAILFGPILIKLPNGREEVTTENVKVKQKNNVSASMIFWFFVALTLFNVAIGMLWGFVERRTDELNMDPSQLGAILAALPIGGAIGGILAGIIGHKFGRLKPFVVALLICTTACFLFGLVKVDIALLIATFVLGIFELFVVAFFIGTASSMDNVGRLATLAGGMTQLTYGLGPALGGLLSGHFSVSEICQISGLLCLVAALISVPVGLLLDKRVVAVVASPAV